MNVLDGLKPQILCNYCGSDQGDHYNVIYFYAMKFHLIVPIVFFPFLTSGGKTG